MSDYYDRDGTPMTLEQWANTFERQQKKRVAEDTVGRYWISTVWLGLNHNFYPDGPPLIFETMVFGTGPRTEGEPDLGDEQGQWRYSTEAEALCGHAAIVAAARHGIPFDEISVVPEWEESK